MIFHKKRKQKKIELVARPAIFVKEQSEASTINLELFEKLKGFALNFGKKMNDTVV